MAAARPLASLAARVSTALRQGGRLGYFPAKPDGPDMPDSSGFFRSACYPGTTTSGRSAMTRRRQVYEGKAKVLFEGPEPGTLVQYFKDDATAFNNKKKGTITGKGVLNNRISEYLMQRLGDIGVPTHFVRRLNMREQLIKEVEIIPLEIVIRNVAAGSLSQRLGIPEGTTLPRSIVELYYKNDELGDPMVTEEHITAFGWATTQEIDEVLHMSLRINDFLSGLFLGIGIRLVDFKLEYGRHWQNEEMRIILADEISPDNCRLWDIKTNEKMDKDRFRRDLGNVAEAYQEVARRLGILPEGGPRDMKGPATMQ
jgi:phosphoribosylaminoimidazole-succinocarboxamide synthase